MAVDPDVLRTRTYELEVACPRAPAVVSLDPLYDSKMERIMA